VIRPKIYFATPCYRSDPNAAVRWASACATELQLQGSIGVEAMCPWIDVARMMLLAGFLRTACDAILYRDDDVSISPRDVGRMIDSKTDAIVAPYYKRVRGAAIWAREALGAALIRRHVIEGLYTAHPELHFEQEGVRLVGLFDPLYIKSNDKLERMPEDRAFWHRVRSLGFQVEALDDVIVNHAGEISHFKK
jgi:hypothetical protein